MTGQDADFNWREDAYRSWEVGRAAQRERGIRAGLITPQDEREREWAAEGPRPVQELEAGRT